jgi:hypothetical protein
MSPSSLGKSTFFGAFARVANGFLNMGIPVRTYYGTLVKAMPFPEIACGDIHKAAYEAYSKATGADDFSAQADFVDNTNRVEAVLSSNAQLQSCRRKVMANPSQYSSDWQYGAPYKTSVSQVTRDFVNSVIDRLSK